MPEEKQKSWFYRHWILTLIVIFFIFMLIGSSGNNSDKNPSQQNSAKEKLPSLESEVANVGTSLTQYRVINRNDYDWHNVKITVNEYYSCWNREILESGNSILVNAVTCNQFAINNQIVESIWIECDEGVARYSLK